MNAVEMIKACERLIQTDYSERNSEHKGRLEKFSHCVAGI